jgi:adenylyltransferase/sulfurtransferase
MLYDKVGPEGQQRLAASRVALFGCGALGTVLANTLVRAGVGFVRLCDRDFIEIDNLQRQILFDEGDIAANLPKAQAAAIKLRAVNSQVRVEPHVVDVNPANIVALADGVDLLLDGTDNFETRFLINDLAVQSRRPWIYGAVIGATGLCMTIVPGRTPCLRCIFEEAPPPDMNPTCDTAGVLAPAVNVVASLQAIEAMKLLMGRIDEINPNLVHLDLWTGRMMGMNVQTARQSGTCPCCARNEFEFLRGGRTGTTAALCGRNAVQIVPPAPPGAPVDLAVVAARLASAATEPVRHNVHMLRATLGGYELTLFPDARAIIKGTSDPAKARSLYARFFGS